MKRTRRFRGPDLLLALALATAASPVPAAVWTRSVNVVPIPRGSKQEFKNASYFTRDWTVAVTSVSVKDDATAAGSVVAPVWIFNYRNTDREAHYVAISVECRDPRHQPTVRYKAVARLEPDRKDDTPLEVVLKVPSDDWKRSAFSKVTIDFLSGPDG